MVELSRSLSFKVILLITINSIIGSGLFILPAIGARESGPASIVSWIILSAITIYVASCFAELAGMFPKAGGIYEFSKQAYGRFVSFMVGWVAWLVGNITTAMLVVAAIRYLIPEAEGSLPILGINVPIKAFQLALCLFWVLLLNYFTYRGIKTSSFMLVTFAVITLGVVLMLAVPAALHFKLSNLIPFFTKPGGFSGNIVIIIVTIFLISETFFGLESVLFLAEETKNPTKIIPKALMVGTIIITGITIFLVISTLGAIPWAEFSSAAAPFTLLAVSMYGIKIKTFMTIATYLVILGAAAGWIVTGPRLVLALAKDKLMLSQFAHIHPTYLTPSKAIGFQTGATVIFLIISFFGEGYETLLELLTPLVLMMLALVLFTVYVLRKKMPDVKRPFKMPFGKVGSILAALFHIGLIVLWIIEKEMEAYNIFKLGILFMIVGIPMYFLISLYYDPRAIRKTSDLTSYFNLFTERISMPIKVRKEILSYLGELNSKVVLEYGCGVGTLTLELSKFVGPKGKVYAMDLSKNNLMITQKRMEQAMWTSADHVHGKVHVIYDEQQTDRVHPLIPYADAVVSVGMLAYIQNIQKVLKELNNIMPNKGHICFVEFGDFFKSILPNVEWLQHNSKIESIFRECGFSVQVTRKRGLFWNYIIVYGIKSEVDIPYI